ncbi:hypothetical protein OSTOST_12495, partial [Ostertagia ostertagi]
MLKHLLVMIPEHRIYCEPFFGGGALFFAKPKAEVEVINDVNGEVTKFSALQKEIQATLHSRELYKKAMKIYNDPQGHSDVDRAWALWTATNQGFAGMIGSWGFGTTNSKEKSLANKRENFINVYEERLKTVQVENNDALKELKKIKMEKQGKIITLNPSKENLTSEKLKTFQGCENLSEAEANDTTQRKTIQDYIDRSGRNVVGFFGGTYESAKTDGRKEFLRMIDFIKKNKGK